MLSQLPICGHSQILISKPGVWVTAQYERSLFANLVIPINDDDAGHQRREVKHKDGVRRVAVRVDDTPMENKTMTKMTGETTASSPRSVRVEQRGDDRTYQRMVFATRCAHEAQLRLQREA